MRLRWYSAATARLLLRRWQMILLLAGTLVPIGGSLLAVAAYPVLVLLETDHGIVWKLGAIGMWQGCWVLWALMQQDQLRGGQFADYLRALPIAINPATLKPGGLHQGQQSLVFMMACAIGIASPGVISTRMNAQHLTQSAHGVLSRILFYKRVL